MTTFEAKDSVSTPNELPVSIVMARRPWTEALVSGSVRPVGLSPQYPQVDPIIDAYRRMIRSLEFDICEMAPVTYLAACEAGAAITALPIFLARHFHHHAIVCRKGSGIGKPADIAGKQFGIRAYSVTTAVWVRGMLEREFGVDPSKVTWAIDDDEHVQTIRLPVNVQRLQQNDSLIARFVEGSVDITLTGAGGIGQSKNADPILQRQAAELQYPLFPDAALAERNWYLKSAIYPIHALVVIKTELLRAYPWIAQSLLDAFVSAKAAFFTNLNRRWTELAEFSDQAHLGDLIDDPLPYGIAANKSTLTALVEFAYRQGILHRRPQLEDVFVEPTSAYSRG